MLGLGAIGLLLPVWPTTPFVLVSVACFSSSPQIKAQILKIPFFREIIQNYEQRTGLSKKTVLTSMIWLWGTLIISVVLIQNFWISLLLILIGAAVTSHILLMAETKVSEDGKNGMKRVFGTIEAVFDISYLGFGLYIGMVLLLSASGNPTRLLAGAAALLLVAGDAFHLVPRIALIQTGKEEQLRGALGTGKQITSITITLFYVLLWQIGVLAFSPKGINVWSYLVYGLTAIRIFLCLLPQNQWKERFPPIAWGITRNIPFFLQGLVVAGLFFIYRNAAPGLTYMWLAIALSFAFYLPVVLWVNKNPRIGMLMLPKICAYSWMLVIFLSL